MSGTGRTGNISEQTKFSADFSTVGDSAKLFLRKKRNSGPNPIRGFEPVLVLDDQQNKDKGRLADWKVNVFVVSRRSLNGSSILLLLFTNVPPHCAPPNRFVPSHQRLPHIPYGDCGIPSTIG
uniref:Uncharacterized protein n=1 Tax=Spongospora subterranea TaxID=70186 RepID=A0A0H5R6H5_9EUKA|eukprot:CRZ03859.1 hypothetical protein [Spongospora subterranea]